MIGQEQVGLLGAQLSDQIGSFIAILCTLAIFSFLYRDNPVYKLAEHLFVGVSAAYGVVVVYFNVLRPNFGDRFFSLTYLKANPLDWGLLIIPLVLGLMMFGRFSERFRWMLAFPLAFVVGAFAGVNIPGYASADLVKQIQATMVPLNVRAAEVREGDTVNIYGVAFGRQGPRSKVYFAETGATFGLWTDKRITVTVPKGAAPTGKLKVANHFGRTVASRYKVLPGKKGGKIHTLPRRTLRALKAPAGRDPTAGPRPLGVAPLPQLQWLTNISAALNLVGLCCALFYFFFSRAHTGALGVVSRVGVWFLMISFGASFGYTVMGRVSLAVGRAQELIEHPWATLAALVLVVAVLVVWRIRLPDGEQETTER